MLGNVRLWKTIMFGIRSNGFVLMPQSGYVGKC